MHLASSMRLRWFIINYIANNPVYNSMSKIKVLDVGSMDVNGSYKGLFVDPKFEYTGLDITAGPNVDLVLNSQYDWSSIESDTYDVVVSGQVLEHVEFFWVTFAEMSRVLKPGGLLCLQVPTNAYEHRYPIDCYRFLEDSMKALANYTCLDILYTSTDDVTGSITESEDGVRSCVMDSILVASKPYSGLKLINLKDYK